MTLFLNILKAVFALSVPKNTCVRGQYRNRNLLNTKLVSHHRSKITGVTYEFSIPAVWVPQNRKQNYSRTNNLEIMCMRIMTTSTEKTGVEKFLENYARFSLYGAA